MATKQELPRFAFSDEMISILTNGIGRDLWLPIRKNYHDIKAIVVKHDLFKSLTTRKKQLCIDLLALSIFHTQVIVPLHGSMNFFKGVQRLGAKSVRMGTYSLESTHFTEVDHATKQFFAILKTFGIQVSEMSFGSIGEFLENVRDRQEQSAQ